MITPLKLVAKADDIGEKFGNVEPGTVFRWASQWFLKLRVGAGENNVVDLITYKPQHFCSQTEVYPFENPQLWLNDRPKQP